MSSRHMVNCANTHPAPCLEEGTKACGNCKLVSYCDAGCQRLHWSDHKSRCKEPLVKASWRPGWDREARDAAWAQPSASRNWHNPFGGEKYLWGNTPAIDVLDLKNNEGVAYDRELSLLFAASGDLRHVVKTIASLRPETNSRLRIDLNDREIAVVERNSILLLLALHSSQNFGNDQDKLAKTAELMIHVWYSAFITKEIQESLQNEIGPLLKEVKSDVQEAASNRRIEKVWTFQGGTSLRALLSVQQWKGLLGCLDCTHARDRAIKNRHAVTLADSRVDYRDRWYFKMHSPFMRGVDKRFREDGIVLPFGRSRDGFDIPNPTLFRRGQWLLGDKADPLSGWDVKEVQQTPWPAANDRYGKLYSFLRGMMLRFLLGLRQSRVEFSLHCIDAVELGPYIGTRTYDRIEVSNICDGGYLGIQKTVELLGRYLSPRATNPHATLITLFINAVKETQKRLGEENLDIKGLSAFLPPLSVEAMLNMQSPEIMRYWDARDMVADVDHYFRSYMKTEHFDEASKFGLRRKVDNTIVDAWPTRQALSSVATPTSIDAFRLILASEWTTLERYVEWQRIARD